VGGDEGARCGRGVRPDEGDYDGIVPSSTHCERPAKQTGGEHVGEARDGGPCEGTVELSAQSPPQLALRLVNSKTGCCVLREPKTMQVSSGASQPICGALSPLQSPPPASRPPESPDFLGRIEEDIERRAAAAKGARVEE
jgi:hypothetical protein